MTSTDRNALSASLTKLRSFSPARWQRTCALVDYAAAQARMRAVSQAIASDEGRELVWLVEHPPLYTAGTSARPCDLLDADRFPVFTTGRGGQYTYHGPGQRVAYVMLDLRRRGRDVRACITGLEQWIIETLAVFGIEAARREDRVGVWVDRPDKGADREDKIAAIGLRVSRWATRHGIAINLNPDLSHYSGIVPCGIRDHGVTSLHDLGKEVSMEELDAALMETFISIFGPVEVLEDAS